MAGETTSPNMNLPVPGVSVTNGPTWASDLNNCLNLIDSHTHTSGSGVAITPDAIDINSDLSFASNDATDLRSAQFTAQSSAVTDLLAVYVSGVDLYYTDGSGNHVRITQSGGVAGSPGSISNLVAPASAAYSAAGSKFIWQSDSNIAADMDFGAAIMRNITPNSTYAITLQPPAALASNYSITLPSLPGSQKFMTLDASGNIAAPWAVDSSTVEISGGTTLQVKDEGIGTDQLADESVTPAKMAALGQQVSTSSGSFSTGSTTFTDVTNLSVAITTTGRPVWVGLIPTTSSSPAPALVPQSNNTGTAVTGDVQLLRDSTAISIHRVANTYPSSTGIHNISIPVGTVWTIDAPAAGTYTYKAQARVVSTDSMQVLEAKLVVIPL